MEYYGGDYYFNLHLGAARSKRQLKYAIFMFFA